ncbi:Primosomal replication protein n [Candidatus Gullanella endobia]|uniref:Replication restart protein PriB n=1 Tax=Candidatus Gullanella endobia TaxID=1070130 RepID=A0A143WQY4_9ENTR|nr:primosomal replication protein N [Candidatus Gullanella endobia]CUX96128.1 Primosomal replication protein n [Candidatus Gullanella endobia]
MTANYLILSGIVCKTPIRKVSPSGIPHCQFMLEHRSMQHEAGFLRQVWCRLPIVINGKQIIEITRSIKIGEHIIVQGFINYHQGRNGFGKIVLHVEKIDLLKSGD